MRKYLSLFLVLAIAFTVGVQITKAEERVSTDARAEARMTLPLMPPMGVKAKADLRLQGSGEELPKESTDRMMPSPKKEDGASADASMQENGMPRLENLRAKLKDEKDSTKEKIKEVRITGREKALEKFSRAMTRIKALKDRVNTRISELEIKGVSVNDAKNFTATAQVKLDAADAKSAEINALLALSIDELNADNKAKLKVMASDMQTLLKDAQGALMDAVKSLQAQVKIKLDAKASSEVKTSKETQTTNQ